jgi:hypothetical protein
VHAEAKLIASRCLRGAAALTLCAVAILGSGCGTSGHTITTTVTTKEVAHHALPAGVSSAHRSSVRLNNPAQRPDPDTVTPCNEAKVGHACEAGTTAPSDPNQYRQRNCDTNIVANSAASCAFAENVFYEYYESAQEAAHGGSVNVHSPATGKEYSVFCSLREGLIACTGEPAATGIYVSFPARAISEYTPAQATAYAASRDVGHPATVAPTSVPEEEPESEPEDESEPESNGESEGPGSLSHAEDSTFCSSHECIANFPNGNGTVVECSDGTWSHSGGLSGACSDHGGED